MALADQTPLNICVCTVGGGTMAPVMSLSNDVITNDFERNVVTTLLAIRHSAAAMVPHGGGSIVCLSSTAGGYSFPLMGSYSVAKAAKPRLIASDEKQRAQVLREKPPSRMVTVDDIAEAVRYLASPESSWVTGTVLPVEGGSHLRRAVDLEILARSICGDDSIDRALRGQLPAEE